jgi:hypothetical protein
MREECLNLEGSSDMDEKWGQHGCKWDHAYSEDMDEIPNENDMDENDKQDEKPIRRIENE